MTGRRSEVEQAEVRKRFSKHPITCQHVDARRVEIASVLPWLREHTVAFPKDSQEYLEELLVAVLDSESRSLQAAELYDAMGMQGDDGFEFVVQLWRCLLAGCAIAKTSGAESANCNRLVPSALDPTDGTDRTPSQLNFADRKFSSPTDASERSREDYCSRPVATISEFKSGHDFDSALDPTPASHQGDTPPFSRSALPSGEGTQLVQSSGNARLSGIPNRPEPVAFDDGQPNANLEMPVTRDESDRKERRKKSRFARIQADKQPQPDDRNRCKIKELRGGDSCDGKEMKEERADRRDLKEMPSLNPSRSFHGSHESRSFHARHESALYDRFDAHKSRSSFDIDHRNGDERPCPRSYRRLGASEGRCETNTYRRSRNSRSEIICPESCNATETDFWRGERRQGQDSSIKQYERGGRRGWDAGPGSEHDRERPRRDPGRYDRWHYECHQKPNRIDVRVVGRHASHYDGGRRNFEDRPHRRNSTANPEPSIAEVPSCRPSSKLARSLAPKLERKNELGRRNERHANEHGTVSHRSYHNETFFVGQRPTQFNSDERNGVSKNWDEIPAQESEVNELGIRTFSGAWTSSRSSGEPLVPDRNAHTSRGLSATGKSHSVGSEWMLPRCKDDSDNRGRSSVTGRGMSTSDKLAAMKRTLLLKLKVQRSLGKRELSGVSKRTTRK